MRNWLRALASVLSGNLIYFLVLMPVLPEALRHRPLAWDLGLLLDFGICLVIHVALGRLMRPGAAGPPAGGAPPSGDGPGV
jgi:hypothetical protein